MAEDRLPSWHDGAARTALLDFLDAAEEIPPDQRVAVFDNDGTLWCEKPRYPQLDFLVWGLRQALVDRPELGSIPEYEAVLADDPVAIADMGLERVAVALLALFESIEPEAFDQRVRDFFVEARHPERGVPYEKLVYEPMLELLAALSGLGFRNCIVTGGGTEFVRVISQQLYGIDPERVVGSLVAYDLTRRDNRLVLLRTRQFRGEANEGATKIANIQAWLGRHPVFAAGNSPGDTEMLEYTNSLPGPSLALLVNHDDAEREYAYESQAGSYVAEEPVVATATRLGWTQVSMRDDWATVFPDR
jgi:phosphoglycolate phosphatase-like HAD superfamily hydrolase